MWSSVIKNKSSLYCDRLFALRIFLQNEKFTQANIAIYGTGFDISLSLLRKYLNICSILNQ